jgi:hypothetical protein
MKYRKKETDQQIQNKTKEKETEESILTNNFFNLIILFTIIGTGLIISRVKKLREELLEIKHPSYKFPHIQDFYYAIASAIILTVFSNIFIIPI